MTEQLIPLQTEDHNTVALWKMAPNAGPSDQQVFLTHGTFSNRKVMMGIVDYLVGHSYTCWVLEWRNHGDSPAATPGFDFETIGQQDISRVFTYLFEEEGVESLDCITHSGGGICLTIALILYPEYRPLINSLSLFACQAFGASTSFGNRTQIYVSKQLSRTLGFVPARKIGGAENEAYPLMKQWYNWNLSRDFLGKSGIDYRARMKEVQVPVMAIYGAGDTFIAPPSGCEAFLAAFKNPQNHALYCGKSTGFAEDYSHSRILHSRNARKEIYPKVREWMENT